MMRSNDAGFYEAMQMYFVTNVIPPEDPSKVILRQLQFVGTFFSRTNSFGFHTLRSYLWQCVTMQKLPSLNDYLGNLKIQFIIWFDLNSASRDGSPEAWRKEHHGDSGKRRGVRLQIHGETAPGRTYQVSAGNRKFIFDEKPQFSIFLYPFHFILSFFEKSKFSTNFWTIESVIFIFMLAYLNILTDLLIILINTLKSKVLIKRISLNSYPNNVRTS